MIVKVCGITTVDDARMVLEAGADWIGLNLVAGPRRIDIEVAKGIIAGLDDPSRAVVLIAAEVGRLRDEMLTALHERGVGRIQLYGDDMNVAIAQVHGAGLEAIEVVHVDGDESIGGFGVVLDRHGVSRPDYVLLDSGAAGQLGGTGTPADWDAIARAGREGRLAGWPPIILAGGLTAENVASAIRRVRPAGVDVSSGVERSPGRKDSEKVRAFVQAVRATPL